MMDSSAIMWFRFRVPLRRPLTVGGQTLSFRECLVVRLMSDDGAAGWGEAAPLPGFHGWCTIEELIEHAHNAGKSFDASRLLVSPPSVRFAMSSAEAWLLHDSQTDTADVSREVKATLLINRDNHSLESLQQAMKYSCIKVKVGSDPVADATFVRELRDAIGPEPKLRADANRRWNLNQAIEFGQAVGNEMLEFLEEPCDNPDNFEVLRNETGLRIAADESVQDAGDSSAIERILDVSDYLVIKPTMIGSLDRCRELAQRAYSRGAGVVVSSAYETGVGMRGLLLLILSLKGTDPAPGLGTYNLIADDILESRLPIQGSSFDLQSALRHVNVDTASLERIA
ncbi:MAG: o-succinylbenzoate synthase [Rhodothermales bacterium]|nr:o-succinylbenzoate synthase [Rhodothermales bacterium]